jgi:hypothetical protein
VEDSIAHSAGIGSATFYALGEIHATNVVGLSENGPMTWGYYKAVIDHGRLLRPTYNILLSLAVPLIGSIGKTSGLRIDRCRSFCPK